MFKKTTHAGVCGCYDLYRLFPYRLEIIKKLVRECAIVGIFSFCPLKIELPSEMNFVITLEPVKGHFKST